MTLNQNGLDLASALMEFVKADAERLGTTKVVKPGHYVPFHWPPRAISLEYHVKGDAFVETEAVEFENSPFTIRIAETPYGVFGRVDNLWHEARGETREDVIRVLGEMAKPILARQREIAQILGLAGRFEGKLADLDALSLMKLLYAQDRSIVHDAMVAIETFPNPFQFGPPMIAVLRDAIHPYRRSAQWGVLDMLEDLPTFCPSEASQNEAIRAIRDLVFYAEDDYARAVYKAGVVLGGHICTPAAGEALLECFKSASKIGRRAAYHAAFHLAEWLPSYRDRVIEGLKNAAVHDPEEILREYCMCMARDVERGEVDHVADPMFPEELSA
ncbi:MAG: hypothetical protein JST40_03785 [Armatimonadetes bacterium]|nr:hypothetical protein [Armatimonadota bacterium]